MRRSVRVSLTFLAAILLALTAASLSTRVAVWLVDRAARQYLHPKHFSFSKATGNLVRGLALTGLEFRALERLAPTLEGTAASVFLSPGQIRVTELHLSGLPSLPDPAVVDIQTLTMALPPVLKNLRRLDNGRLRLGASDPVLFYLNRDDSRQSFHVYGNGLRIKELWPLLAAKKALPVSGTLSQIDLELRGDWKRWVISGSWRIEDLLYRGVLIGVENCRMDNLVVEKHGERTRVTGTILLTGGQARRANTMLELSPGRLIFSGEAEAPELDLSAKAMIGKTRIDLTLRGTADKPDLRLSSQPAWPEEKILLMLATGKEWEGLDRSFEKGRVTSDLAGDFIDYFAFGGSGSKLIRHYGIKKIHIEIDETGRSAEIKKQISRKIDVGYGVEQVAGATQPVTAQKVGVDYKLSESSTVSVEGKRAVRNKEKELNATDPADDRLTVQMKKSF